MGSEYIAQRDAFESVLHFDKSGVLGVGLYSFKDGYRWVLGSCSRVRS